MDKKMVKTKVKEAYDEAIMKLRKVEIKFDDHPDAELSIGADVCIKMMFVKLYFPGGNLALYPTELNRKEIISLVTDFIWRRYFKQ